MTQLTGAALGCMRLSTDPDRDDARGVAVLRAALDAGATLFDTARAYCTGDDDLGHNERLLARAVGESGVDPSRIRIVTKCGMRRPDGAWRPDGRATAIAEDARASRDALGGLAIDVLLLHARDPRRSFATSVRALARARDEGFARTIGLSNVTVAEIEEALAVAPITTVEVALGAFDDASARGGVVRFCMDRGIEVLAHSPLGGPKRAHRLAKDRALLAIAEPLGVTPAQLVLAYIRHLHAGIAPLAGARTIESAKSAIAAARITLDLATLARLDERFPALGDLRRGPPPRVAESSREVVLVMGIPGAGKSRAAEAFVARGYERLNRDTVGGTLRDLARTLDDRLAAGADRVVLDNTYTTRASRNDVIRAAHTHGARVRCVFLDTPLRDAQINVVLRMIRKHGALLEPDAIARLAKSDPNLVRPTVLFRMVRELERPAADEGFSEITVAPFEREPPRDRESRAGAVFPIDRVAHESSDLALRDDAVETIARTAPGASCLLIAWRPDADEAWKERARALAALLALRSERHVELGLCTHPAGPPVCWCRPPLPGLTVAFAERYGVDALLSFAHESVRTPGSDLDGGRSGMRRR